MKNHEATLKNHKNPAKTIKNHETTVKNHGNQPKTMRNHETIEGGGGAGISKNVTY